MYKELIERITNKMNYDAIAVTVSQLNSYIKDKIAEDEALNAVVVKAMRKG